MLSTRVNLVSVEGSATGKKECVRTRTGGPEEAAGQVSCEEAFYLLKKP